MDDFDALDMAVVIPTQNRWSVLEPTIDALKRQNRSGFETIVVVDQNAVTPGFLDEAHVVERHSPGVAAARNAGVSATDRAIVLFLGDDTIPESDLISCHLAVHRRNPERETGALGSVVWHPEVARGRLQRWLEWSGTQFEYHTITGEEAGWGRLYTSNVSLKRELLVEVGGFDEEFFFGYEDTELGLRLHDKGLRLLYEPRAKVWHLHRYEWPAIQRRFLLVGGGEYLMVRKHPEFAPYFLEKLTSHRPVAPLSLWPWLVDYVPSRPASLRRAAELRADAWYSKHLAPPFAAGWLAAQELDEMGEETGDGHYQEVAAACLAQQRWLGELLALVPSGGHLLTVGCSATLGIALAAAGYRLTFVAEDSTGHDVMCRRLERRGLGVSVVFVDELEARVPPEGFEAALIVDVEGSPGQEALGIAERTCELVAISTRAGGLPGGKGRTTLLRRRYEDGHRLRVYRGDRRPRPTSRRSGQRNSRDWAKGYAGRWLGRRPWVPTRLST